MTILIVLLLTFFLIFVLYYNSIYRETLRKNRKIIENAQIFLLYKHDKLEPLVLTAQAKKVAYYAALKKLEQADKAFAEFETAKDEATVDKACNISPAEFIATREKLLDLIKLAEQEELDARSETLALRSKIESALPAVKAVMDSAKDHLCGLYSISDFARIAMDESTTQNAINSKKLNALSMWLFGHDWNFSLDSELLYISNSSVSERSLSRHKIRVSRAEQEKYANGWANCYTSS